MSLLLRPAPAPEVAALLPMVLAYLLCREYSRCSHRPAWVKWPNDVLVAEGKLAGILAEYGGRKESWLVMGLGVNLSEAPSTEEEGLLPSAAWSQQAKAPDPSELESRILAGLDRLWPERALNPLPDIRPEIERMMWMRGREVTAPVGRRLVRGVVEGLDDLGHLRLYGPDGTMTLDSGEARPIGLENPVDIPEGGS